MYRSVSSLISTADHFFMSGEIKNFCDEDTGCVPIEPPIQLDKCPEPDVIVGMLIEDAVFSVLRESKEWRRLARSP